MWLRELRFATAPQSQGLYFPFSEGSRVAESIPNRDARPWKPSRRPGQRSWPIPKCPWSQPRQTLGGFKAASESHVHLAPICCAHPKGRRVDPPPAGMAPGPVPTGGLLQEGTSSETFIQLLALRGENATKLWWVEGIGVFLFFPHCRLRALMRGWTLIPLSLSHPQERESQESRPCQEPAMSGAESAESSLPQCGKKLLFGTH